MKNEVKNFLSKPHEEGLVYSNNVNAAVYIFSPDIFRYIIKGVSSDFGADIFPMILAKGDHIIRAYNTAEYLKDLGTPKRLESVEKAYFNGTISARNKINKRPAIFIDRDGVINQEVDNLRNIDDFVLIPGVASAIKKINQSNFLAIVITNQPVVAKGFLSEDELNIIHKKMETLLGEQHAFLNKIYYCPHHPDSGFEGEVKKLKFDCSCRKPNIGMIIKATKEFNIDLAKSYFVGDTTSDIKTGINAGVKTILVKTGYAGSDKKFNVQPDATAENLQEAINLILEN